LLLEKEATMKCGSMKGLQNAAQILLVCIPVQAQAVDYSSCPCVTGLIPDIHIDNADVRSRAYLRDVMCQLDFTEFQHKYGAEAGGNYGVISGNANFNEANYQSTKRQLCTDRTEETNASALTYSSKQVIPGEARTGFVSCVKYSCLCRVRLKGY
jgi:hypothetical protein